MKLILNITFMLVISGSIFSVTEVRDYWSRINNFEYKSFVEEYNQLKRSDENSIKIGTLAYAIYLTGDKDSQWLEIASDSISSLIESEDIPRSELSELSYILADSYLNLITDTKSWLAYAGKYEDSIARCIEFDPENILYNINSAKGLMWLPSSRGSYKDGAEILLKLERENPSHIDVLMAVSDYRFDKGQISEAEAGYRLVLELNKNHKDAIDRLNTINLSQKGLEIRDIVIVNNTHTSKKRLLNKISFFMGDSYSILTKRNIIKKISEISSVNTANVRGFQVDNKYVDLEVTVKEDNTKGILILEKGAIGLDHDNGLFPDGLPPVVVYFNKNFFGTGNSITFYTAGVYNKIDLTIPGIINDSILDLKIALTSMALPLADINYSEGMQIDSTKKNSYHSISAGLGRSFGNGFSSFVHYRPQLDVNESLGDNITPKDLVTHTITGEFIYDIAGTAVTKFQTLNGLRFSFVPEWIYKPDYKAWGRSDNPFEHDDSPALIYKTKAFVYKNLSYRDNLMLCGSWLANNNPYESTRFRLGHGTTALASEYISGYLPGELVFDNGLLFNINYTHSTIPDKFHLFVKYDLLFNISGREYYNGCALGSVIQLPADIVLEAELGIGVDAVRESGPGFIFSVGLEKFMIL